MHYCYIIKSCSTNKYYIGSCSDIKRRLEYHNNGWSRYTKSGVPWELYYTECFESKTEAIKKEIFIKSKKSRKFIENLIEKTI
jgi:putative endonuclease